MKAIFTAGVVGSFILTGAMLAGCGSQTGASQSQVSSTMPKATSHFYKSSSQPSVHSPALVSLKMISPHTGWAIGANGSILHTTNGGSIWRTVSSTAIQHVLERALDRKLMPLTHDTFISANFPSNAVAWVGVKVGTHLQIFQTNDGGTNWNQSTLAALKTTSTLALSSMNGQRAWVMDAVSGLAGSSTIKLWQTSNGDGHWNVVQHGPAPADASITFAINGIGWETGTSSVFNQVVMARSRDGGIHWKQVPWTLPAGQFQVSTFTPQYDGATPIVPSLLVNQHTQKQQWVFQRWNATTNTWNALPTLPKGTDRGSIPPLSAFEGKNGWVVGNKNLDILQHGHWHTEKLPPGTPLAISFVTAKRGWLLQGHRRSSTLWMTNNGGRTWEELNYR